MAAFLLEKADIFIYTLDLISLKAFFLDEQGKLIKKLSSLYLRLVK